MPVFFSFAMLIESMSCTCSTTKLRPSFSYVFKNTVLKQKTSNLVMATSVCNPSAQEAEVGGS
jgi:hypothetical protein